jgi:hypothetical protein
MNQELNNSILKHVQKMKKHWQGHTNSSAWPNVRKRARYYVIAYEEMERYITYLQEKSNENTSMEHHTESNASTNKCR